MVSGDPSFLRVAVPVPLRRGFDFVAPAPAARGTRVLVPFGRRHRVGIVLETVPRPAVAAHRIRPIVRLLDSGPAYSEALFDTLWWAAEYYHHPVGEVLFAALPPPLRTERPLRPRIPMQFHLTARGRDGDLESLQRAPLQQAIVKTLREDARPYLAGEFAPLSRSWRPAVSALVEKGWVQPIPALTVTRTARDRAPSPSLTPHQRTAADALIAALGGYRCFLLHGVTGSGKTEVYLRVVEACLARAQQALVMVPEIALTPQLVERFRNRVGAPVAVLHSGIGDAERHRIWWSARNGETRVVLGTRSAVFTPFSDLGAIVVDEEHDPSYKQQDGFRYHARDLAIFRARRENTPIVLGSATPSLETLANVAHHRFHLLELPERVAGARLPEVHILDLRGTTGVGGLAAPLVRRMSAAMKHGEQSLIYLNRRGFAPVLLCTQCRWIASCERCDARLTFHKRDRELRCHHCGRRSRAPEQCPACAASDLESIGEGTQRIEETLNETFAGACIVRVDRDSVRSRERLTQTLTQVNSGAADILVGTQLLGKGHDFPQVTTVGVVNADQGLFSVDFRALEHLFQRVMQVAGRAGRARKPGVVLVQTRYPDHPYWKFLKRHDYRAFANAALAERRAAHCPPYTHFALVRSESVNPKDGFRFLRAARRAGADLAAQVGIRLMDVVASPMEKRAGRYRAQLLVAGDHRKPLHAFLSTWIARIEVLKPARRVRWSVDVDPMDMY